MRWLPSLVLATALLPTEVAAGRQIGDLYRDGEEAVWVFEVDGARIGENWFRYDGVHDLLGVRAHRFTSTVRLAAAGAMPVEQRYHSELWTDDEGHPLRHVFQLVMGEAYTRLEMSIAEGHASVRLVQGTSARELEVDAPRSGFIQANNFIGYFELMLGLAGPIGDDVQNFRLFSTNVLREIPYRVNQDDEFTREINGRTVTGRILLDSLGETLHVTDEGRLLALEVESQNLVIRRTNETVEPVEIEPPDSSAAAPLDGEEVTIVHGAVELAGTITKPPGASTRLPAIFLISGSGGQDRNGYSSGIDVGTHEILDRLTQEGYLVLRVDDRGVGESKGPTDDVGYLDLVADALACVDFLLERDDVDVERVAIIGHSEGGITAPILAHRRPQIAAVVLMAATGRNLIEVIMGQNELALTRAGIEGAEREEALTEVRRGLELLASDEETEPGSLPDEFAPLMRNRRWIQEHGRIDPLANVRRLRCPVLIVQGALDFQVSLDLDARALEAALEDANHPDHELRSFPRLDHLFKEVGGDESTLAEYFQSRPVDEEFLAVLVEWLGKRLGKPAGEDG